MHRTYPQAPRPALELICTSIGNSRPRTSARIPGAVSARPSLPAPRRPGAPRGTRHTAPSQDTRTRGPSQPRSSVPTHGPELRHHVGPNATSYETRLPNTETARSHEVLAPKPQARPPACLLCICHARARRSAAAGSATQRQQLTWPIQRTSDAGALIHLLPQLEYTREACLGPLVEWLSQVLDGTRHPIPRPAVHHRAPTVRRTRCCGGLPERLRRDDAATYLYTNATDPQQQTIPLWSASSVMRPIQTLVASHCG
jgi:hypothetical protein